MPRYAPAMSVEDFKATISAFAESKDFENEYDVEDYDDVENIIAGGMMNHGFPTVHEDVQKIRFDYENVEIEKFMTLSNGVPIALVSAGGDWEVPLLFAFYFDGKKFRGYVPSDGNVYNRTLKQAYGNADEDEDDADALKHHGVDSYGVLEPDFAKCIADIEKRLEVRGTSGAVTFGKNAAAEHRKHLAATEPDLKVLDVIPPDMLMVTVMPAADGSYFELKLRHSGRELTRAEADKVAIPKYFRREDGYGGDNYTWYGPRGMGSRWSAKVLEQAGFAIDPNSYLQDYQVRIIRM